MKRVLFVGIAFFGLFSSASAELIDFRFAPNNRYEKIIVFDGELYRFEASFREQKQIGMLSRVAAVSKDLLQSIEKDFVIEEIEIGEHKYVRYSGPNVHVISYPHSPKCGCETEIPPFINPETTR